MMNFPGAVNADAGVLAKINLGLEHGVVDGHAPGLRGRGLQAYLAAGISSDHECTSADEALEKLRLGMQIFIREGSAARNLEALAPLVSPQNASRFCFCTDDRHPADLRDQGHIDHVVRKAIGLGVDPVVALTIASLNTARHYRLPFRGGLAPGWIADIVLFRDLRAPVPTVVVSEGRVVARDGVCTFDAGGRPQRAGDIPRAPVRLPAGFDASRFNIRAGASGPAALLRVIGMDPHQIVTSELRLPPTVMQGCYVADPARDIAKLAVIERHRGSGAMGLGFVHGFGLQRGAIASTVGHDAHNLAVLGVNDDDMLAAARALTDVGGGLCAVLDGRVLATLPLPVAGLMSDRPAAVVIAEQRRVLDAARALGIPHDDPFMPLSFLPLPVIPALKLSDQGLIDVAAFAPTTLEVGP
jgi:adenine deaminase